MVHDSVKWVGRIDDDDLEGLEVRCCDGVHPGRWVHGMCPMCCCAVVKEREDHGGGEVSEVVRQRLRGLEALLISNLERSRREVELAESTDGGDVRVGRSAEEVAVGRYLERRYGSTRLSGEMQGGLGAGTEGVSGESGVCMGGGGGTEEPGEHILNDRGCGRSVWRVVVALVGRGTLWYKVM